MDWQRIDMTETAHIDYAGPLMAVERLAKEVHHACLDRDYESAREKALALIVEARLTYTSIAHVEEKEKR
jgi:hypothetical protein